MIPIEVHILLSKNPYEFPIKRDLTLHLSRPLGEGSYGKVFELNNRYAIKIFKESIIGNVDMSGEEKSLIPLENENRELLFYFQLLQKNQELFTCSYKYVIQPIAIGVTREILLFPPPSDAPAGSKESRIFAHSYFVILPLCIPFYQALPIQHSQLIHLKKPTSIFEAYQNYHKIPFYRGGSGAPVPSSQLPSSLSSSSSPPSPKDPDIPPFGIAFTLDIMQKMCIASIYLEEEFQIYNLDFKLQNIMFLKSSDPKIPFEDLIVIDFSLIKYVSKRDQEHLTFDYDDLIDQKYFIWPYSGTTLISNLPSYSICINGLELLYGKKHVEQLPSYKKIRAITEGLRLIDSTLYHIFQQGMVHKIPTKRLLQFIQEYCSTKTKD